MVRRSASPVGGTAPVHVPDPALVALVGASGFGKSTWAARSRRSRPGSTRRPTRTSSLGPRSVPQVSRFPWGEDPLAWLSGIARAADLAGFAGLRV